MKDNVAIARSPVADLKSIKNETEVEGGYLHRLTFSTFWSCTDNYVGFRQSHIRDGAALARYFAWLEEQLNNSVELNESQGADQLEKFRSYVICPLSFCRVLTFNIIFQRTRPLPGTFIRYDIFNRT